MTFFDDRDNWERPPGPFGQRQGRGQPPPQIPFKLIAGGAAILLLFSALSVLKSIYADYLWFESVGLETVFRTRIVTQVALFLAGAILAAAAIGSSVWMARRIAPRGLEELFGKDVSALTVRRTVNLMLAAGVLILSLIFGGIATSGWETVLRWSNSVPFGQTDPQFGRDIGFFIFDLPAYRFFHGWIMGLAVVSAIGAAAVYGLTFSLQRLGFLITQPMRLHLSVAAGIVVLLIAAGSYLSIFDVVTNPSGLVYGGMFTDINARLPARYILAGLAALAGVVTIVNAFVSDRGFRLPIAAFAVWAVASIVGGALYPQFVQSFQVAPNELRREEPYIQRNIEATRTAWGLERIEATTHPANPVVTAEEVAANPETLENIRILDPEPLTATLNELQALRPLYRFAGIDISRYPLFPANPDAADQQVLISARELDLARVADRNWTRDRLQLTHGFGAIATPVTEVEPDGLPRLALRDIPPRTSYERLALTEDGARIYFGELTNHYVIANSHEPEFDYPDPTADGRDIRTSFAHDRGIVLSSLFRRLLLAWELGDLNLLISGQIHNDSRLLMHRQIRDRIAKIAPFLGLDSDPYMVIIGGELKWMLPAYTVANRYPYSQPAASVNYIRNSVQVVIDSGTGDMDFYVVDAQDPIIRTWANIFPELFDLDRQMPPEVRQQLRYPLDMFRIQAQLYRRYHVTNAEVFFLGEDFWEIPIQRVRGQTRPMEPYYVTIRLPGQDRVEFVLIMPFTPRDRENTVAWLAGRSDGEHFGALHNFRFPSGVLVFGPSQVENRIEQNALISQQLTLWNSTGSEVLRSTLMMIPVGDSFLYVQPVYLQAAGGRMPELRRVIVANGTAVAMEETFDRALQVAMGERAPAAPDVGPGAQTTGIPDLPQTTAAPAATPAPADLRRLLEQARQSSDATQSELNRLRGLLDQIERQLPQE